jgi:hypothetical protein
MSVEKIGPSPEIKLKPIKEEIEKRNEKQKQRKNIGGDTYDMIFKNNKQKSYDIKKTKLEEKTDQSPPAGDPKITVDNSTPQKAVDSAEEGVKEHVIDENKEENLHKESMDTFSNEVGEKVESEKKEYTQKLSNKLIKTGFFNLETANKFIINSLAGEKNAWEQAKGDFAQEQWDKAQEILKTKVSEVFESIKKFDVFHEKYYKSNSEIFGKYINNLEKSFQSSEYTNIKGIKGIQKELSDMKGLFEINAKSISQLRGKDKGINALKRGLRRFIANILGDKENKIEKSIKAEDDRYKKNADENKSKLFEKIKELKSKLEGKIEEIPENIGSSDLKEVKTGGGETMANLENESSSEKIIGQIYQEFVQKKDKYEAEDKSKLEKLINLIESNPQVKEIKYKDFLGSEVKVDIDNVKKSAESISRKLTTATQKTTTPEKKLFTRRDLVAREKIEKPIDPKTETPVETVIESVRLSEDKRKELKRMLDKNKAVSGDEMRSQKIENLMRIINDEYTSQEDKDIATLQFINYPQVGLDNLDFGDKINKNNLALQKKALLNKINEISKKYTSENDELSKNINSLIEGIKNRFNLEIHPSPDSIKPEENPVPKVYGKEEVK